MAKVNLPACPLPRNERFVGLRWTGRNATYTDTDTWYPRWDRDGNLYFPFTDGRVGEYVSRSSGIRQRCHLGGGHSFGGEILTQRRDRGILIESLYELRIRIVRVL